MLQIFSLLLSSTELTKTTTTKIQPTKEDTIYANAFIDLNCAPYVSLFLSPQKTPVKHAAAAFCLLLDFERLARKHT